MSVSFSRRQYTILANQTLFTLNCSDRRYIHKISSPQENEILVNLNLLTLIPYNPNARAASAINFIYAQCKLRNTLP